MRGIPTHLEFSRSSVYSLAPPSSVGVFAVGVVVGVVAVGVVVGVVVVSVVAVGVFVGVVFVLEFFSVFFRAFFGAFFGAFFRGFLPRVVFFRVVFLSPPSLPLGVGGDGVGDGTATGGDGVEDGTAAGGDGVEDGTAAGGDGVGARARGLHALAVLFPGLAVPFVFTMLDFATRSVSSNLWHSCHTPERRYPPSLAT